MSKVYLIAAASRNRTIGVNNRLPWHLPNDLKFFKERTLGNIVIMGRNTYESIGKPLPGRVNIILTSRSRKDLSLPSNVLTISSINDIYALKKTFNQDIYIIGGQSLYEQCINEEFVDGILLTKILDTVEGDCFFPDIDTERYKVITLYDRYDKSKDEYPFIILEYKSDKSWHEKQRKKKRKKKHKVDSSLKKPMKQRK